ncbi:hypothetical protein PO878_11370 [Iamia majanohamensis]|uniref:Uncharacterized protein n=1 Tax=Iamia majanohamensis TaxID=467976 RepID=A0AAE9Y6D0_9ACTN|nr:hypothetical protein [Iamia majanohamensis]WCO65098.1 hypothetical protein PO878_11370 [Iamia majanohamensis]
MAREDTHTDELAEERPAPGTVVRHRGADVEVRPAARGPASVELHRGAAWLRATARGPGLVLGHGAATLQLADGAAVVEVHDFEALVVVLAGRASVRGVAALPRSVEAGEAVTLTLDGSCSDPDRLAPAELAADRMVVENLALDALAGRRAEAVPPAAEPGPGAAVAPSPTEAPLAQRSPAPGPDEPGAEPAPVAPAPAPPAPPAARRGAVDGPPPEAPRPEPSALESALAGVGVVDRDGDPALDDEAAPPAAAGARRDDEGDDGPGRRRLLLVLVVVALLVVAIVAAVVLGGDGAGAATPGVGSGAVGPAPAGG